VQKEHFKVQHDSTTRETRVTVTCAMCEGKTVITMPSESYHKWRGGTLLQVAAPMVSVDDRELLISRTCDKCWDELFPPEIMEA
jgi:hypothetical protein